jgi:hypothetical protein
MGEVGRINWLGRLVIAAAMFSLTAVAGIVTPASAGAPPAPPAATSFTIPGILYGVATVSARNAWAVGCTGVCGQGGKTLLLHWNGATWSPVTSPKPVYGTLNAVTVVSADNAWAVGQTTNSAGTDDSPLILHWDGRAWTRQSGVPAVSANVNAVAASASSVWAIGGTSGLHDSLILRRVGNRWYVVPTEAPADSFLYSIVLAGSTAWADGVAVADGEDHGVVLRWTGSVWKYIDTPSREANNFLVALAAGPAGALWATGLDYNAERTTYTAISMLWNGKTWRKVPVGSLPRDSFLQSVAFVPGGTAWAVGFAGPSAVSLLWTGGAWSRVPNPEEAAGIVSVLYRVTATAPGNAWAVGFSSPDGQPETLILHWNGKSWS